MKKIMFTIFCFCIIMTETDAQVDTISLQDKYKLNSGSLFKKARHQKTTAWILLASGTVLFTAGESIIAGEQAEEMTNDLGVALTALFTLGYGTYEPAPVKHSAIAPVMVYSGLAAMISSIPMFIAAHKNKKQAKLLIKSETLSLVPSGMNRQMAVGVKINL